MPEDVHLSPRQRQVLELLIEGKGNKQIARDTGLALGTVRAHMQLLYAKLGVRDRIRAAVVGAALLAPKA